MVELHVDDSDHFEAFRAKHPLGGNFSVCWEGRPRSPPSAPPADLPDPGVDAVPTDGEETTAEAIEVGVVAVVALSVACLRRPRASAFRRRARAARQGGRGNDRPQEASETGP